MGSNPIKGREVVRFFNSWPITLGMAALMLFMLMGQDYLGRVEGRYFPAATNAVVNVSAGPREFQSILNGTFDRPRSDCSFERIEWRLAKPGGGSVALDFQFLETSKVRDTGPNDFGPWLLHADSLQIENFVYADVYHKCHPFWLTVTRFYP